MRILYTLYIFIYFLVFHLLIPCLSSEADISSVNPSIIETKLQEEPAYTGNIHTYRVKVFAKYNVSNKVLPSTSSMFYEDRKRICDPNYIRLLIIDFLNQIKHPLSTDDINDIETFVKNRVNTLTSSRYKEETSYMQEWEERKSLYYSMVNKKFNDFEIIMWDQWNTFFHSMDWELHKYFFEHKWKNWLSLMDKEKYFSFIEDTVNILENFDNNLPLSFIDDYYKSKEEYFQRRKEEIFVQWDSYIKDSINEYLSKTAAKPIEGYNIYKEYIKF